MHRYSAEFFLVNVQKTWQHFLFKVPFWIHWGALLIALTISLLLENAHHTPLLIFLRAIMYIIGIPLMFVGTVFSTAGAVSRRVSFVPKNIS